MSGYARIGDLCEQIRGVSYSKSDAILEPRIGFSPILRANNISERGLTYESLVFVPDNKIKDKQRIRKGDVVIAASSGSIDVVGKAAVARNDFDGAFGAFCKVLRPNSTVDPGYFAHYFQTKKYRLVISSLAAGANINNLKNEHLNDLDIRLPSLLEQRRIATILDKADELRQKRRQAIEKLDQLLQSVFLDMFGDPVANPKGFDRRVLSEFYIDPKRGTKCGPFGSALKKHEYTETGVPVWSMDNITLKGEFIDTPTLWITETKFVALEAYSVQSGDVIISRAGTVGKMGVVRSESSNSIISTNLIRVRFGQNLLPEYFVSLMTYCKHRLGRLKTGPDGAFTYMNTGILDSLEFPYPPIELQKKYVDFLDCLKAEVQRHLEARNKANAFFSSLQQRAFNGTL